MNNEEKILQLLAELKTSVDKRFDTIEGRLEELDQRSVRTQVLLETDYHDKLQLLYDGHAAIMEKLDELTPKGRVETLEEEVDFLRSVVKSMSKRLDALEKAQ